MGYLDDLKTRLAYLEQSDANKDAAAQLRDEIAKLEDKPSTTRKASKKT